MSKGTIGIGARDNKVSIDLETEDTKICMVFPLDKALELATELYKAIGQAQNHDRFISNPIYNKDVPEGVTKPETKEGYGEIGSNQLGIARDTPIEENWVVKRIGNSEGNQVEYLAIRSNGIKHGWEMDKAKATLLGRDKANSIIWDMSVTKGYTYSTEKQLKKRDKEPKDQNTAGRYPYKD